MSETTRSDLTSENYAAPGAAAEEPSIAAAALAFPGERPATSAAEGPAAAGLARCGPRVGEVETTSPHACAGEARASTADETMLSDPSSERAAKRRKRANGTCDLARVELPRVEVANDVELPQDRRLSDAECDFVRRLIRRSLNS